MNGDLLGVAENWRESAMAPNPIFVVGCPRTGTTMVSQMLDSHSRIAMYHETHFYPIFYPQRHRYGDLTKETNRKLLLRDVREAIRVQGSEPPPAEIFENPAKASSLATILDTLLRHYASTKGKDRGGDKTPLHFDYAQQITDDFPSSPLLFLMRDPRDTAVSMQRAFDTPIADAARTWSRAFERYREVVPAPVLIRYEELVQNPESEVARICDAIGETYEPAMLRFFERLPQQWRRIPHLDMRLLDKAVSSGSIGTFRELPDRDIEIIEAICAEGMEALGYEPRSNVRVAIPDLPPQPGRLRFYARRLRYYGLKRERWRRAWFRWRMLGRLALHQAFNRLSVPAKREQV